MGPSLRFRQIQRTGLPQLEQARQVSDLDIATDAGLFEPVHVVLFRDNTVDVDFDYNGSRISHLGYYLRVKSDDLLRAAGIA